MRKVFLLFCLFALVGFGCTDSGQSEQQFEIEGSIANEVQEAGIILEAPEEEVIVTSPMTLKGRAKLATEGVYWAIKSHHGDTYHDGVIPVAPSSEYVNFEESIALPVLPEERFYIELYSLDATGGRASILTRALFVEDLGKTTVNIFFIDPELQEFGDCSVVDFEKRTVLKTDSAPEVAMQELLKGPTSEWAITSLPEFATLSSLTIEDGIATVDFADESTARWNGGSCHVISLRSQIEQTLLQFPEISQVVISVNGDSQNILQP